jgi:hypothetical protein
MHFYNNGTQFSRRRDGDAIALRSPILEEFRTNRSRKWELCVSASIITHLLNLIFLLSDRTFMGISWSSAVTSTVQDLFNKKLKQLQATRNK